MLIDCIFFSERLQVSASPELKTAIEQAAVSRGMSLSDYVRTELAGSVTRDGKAFPKIACHTRTDRIAPPHVRAKAAGSMR